MAYVNIKPVSDLNRYKDVLNEVKIGSPVYLTVNGHGRYVIYDIDDPLIELADGIMVSEQLIEKIKRAHEKADEEGWISIDDVKNELRKRKNK